MGRTAGSATATAFAVATECQPDEAHDRRPGRTDAAPADIVVLAAPHRPTGWLASGWPVASSIPDRRVVEGASLPSTSGPICRIGGTGFRWGATWADPHVARIARFSPDMMMPPDPERSGGIESAGQEALGLADISGSVEPVGSLGTVSLAAGEVGVTEAGAVVPAGVLHARTAPPSEAARVRARRIRLNMLERSSVVRGAGGSGHLTRGSLATSERTIRRAPVRPGDARPDIRCRRLAAVRTVPTLRPDGCNDRETSWSPGRLSLAPSA